jgi:hypothetical protein
VTSPHPQKAGARPARRRTRGASRAALARRLDLEQATVRVARKFAELQNGRRVAGPPKSSAGVRTVALPAVLVHVLHMHMAEFPALGDELIFRGPRGAALRRNNFHRSS